MAANSFGVTATTVKEDHFPMFDAFSANSSPSSTVIARFILEKAALLHGRMLLKGIDASAWSDATAAEYLWCRETLTIMVAVKILKVASQQYPELAKALEAEVVERLKALDEGGGTAIGNASLDDSADPPDGPHTHIGELDLSVGDDPAGDASTAAPIFRKDDVI